jgi:hypothetical protein
MTSSRIGRGAIVTLGAAASMAWAAGAANACDTTPQPPKPTNPHTHGHHPDAHTLNAKPNTVCAVHDGDVQYGELAENGSIAGGWHNAVPGKFQRTDSEPYGYEVRLNPDKVDANCTGTVDVSLASYDTGGPTWDSSRGAQSFVGYAHVQLSTKSKTSATQTLTVKLPGTPGSTKCFGQIDLYFGTKIYDGGSGADHGPLPNHDSKPQINTPEGLITAWNGNDIGGCAATPPATNPSTPSSPTTHPSTPATPTTPKSTHSTPTTPATTTPGTPTLAHTGSNAGELSLVALAFFGAGGTAMFASRKAKAAGAGARKH